MLVWLFSKRNVTLRAASGNLAATDVSPEVDSKKFRTAVVDLRITELIMPDGDDEVDFYIQTKMNGTWVDVANVHYDNGDEATTGDDWLIGIGPKAAGVAVVAHTDGTIADDGTADIPLGEAVRVKVLVTGASPPTFAYNAKVSFYG